MKMPSPCATAALLAVQLLCTAPAGAQGAFWPQPKPLPVPPPTARAFPNFQAPSATDCQRPVRSREVPGGMLESQYRPPHLRDEAASLAKSAPERRELAEAGPRGGAAADATRVSPATAAPTAPAFAPPAPAATMAQQRQRHAPDDLPQQLPSPGNAVTAGVVDDNADFTSYLAFRDRTHVAHRPRDVRERHLLEVKDHRGRGVADAEVAVQAPNGYAMWARTDAGGRVWLHPNAFDPSRSPYYDVTVRKEGRQSGTRMVRGQKSAVEVVLDAPAASPRARLDLVFLIDATGSMADEIDKLKATLRTITSEVAGLPSRPDICLGLVAYRDRGDAFLLRSHDFTHDVNGFLQEALMPLRAGGGGDYAEAMNEALHETVHQLSWRGEGATRMVVLLADAPPHLDYGAPHYDDDMQAALGKGIKVFGVGASGLDKQGEFIQRQIAQYTGGKFVFLTYANAHHPASGPGRETVHDVKNYSVDTLDRLIVRLVTEELGKRGG